MTEDVEGKVDAGGQRCEEERYRMREGTCLWMEDCDSSGC